MRLPWAEWGSLDAGGFARCLRFLKGGICMHAVEIVDVIGETSVFFLGSNPTPEPPGSIFRGLVATDDSCVSWMDR